MFEIQYEPKTGLWEKKKEPYITVEVATEKDYEFLKNRVEKQKAKKPIGVDLHGKVSENEHKFVCPICENFLAGRRTVEETPELLPGYCCVCGQKIDWSDVK